MKTEFKVGDRVLVFNHLLYEDDIKTPKSVTMKPATIVKLYRYLYLNSNMNFKSEYLADVSFGHRGLSKGHFVSGIERLNNRVDSQFFRNTQEDKIS